jgi:hypothetical protein
MKDEGRQAGWYAAGGAIATAGITISSVGFAKSPPSETLEILGLIAFFIGLIFIISAMPRSPDKSKSKVKLRGISAHFGHHKILSSTSIRASLAGLMVISVGAAFLLNRQHGEHTVKIASASSTSKWPVQVDTILLQPNADEGQTFVFPKALELNKTELQSLTNLSEKSIQGMDSFFTWATKNGGVYPDQVHIQLTLSGNRDYEVRIMGMQAIGSCGPPLTGNHDGVWARGRWW